jgi:hypothetical protein
MRRKAQFASRFKPFGSVQPHPETYRCFETSEILRYRICPASTRGRIAIVTTRGGMRWPRHVAACVLRADEWCGPGAPVGGPVLALKMHIQSSSPAEAGDPVIRGGDHRSERSRRAGCPACAGHDCGGYRGNHLALDPGRPAWSLTGHAHRDPPSTALVAHLVTGGRRDFPFIQSPGAATQRRPSCVSCVVFPRQVS